MEDDICDDFQPLLTNTASEPGVNVVMVNLPAFKDNGEFDLDEPDEYIACLVEEDPDRIINEPLIDTPVNVVVVVAQTPDVPKPLFTQTLGFVVTIGGLFYQPNLVATIALGQQAIVSSDVSQLTNPPVVNNLWQKVNNYNTDGSAIEAALIQAVQQLSPSDENYVVIITDGVVSPGQNPCDNNGLLAQMEQLDIKLVLLAVRDADFSEELSCLLDFAVVVGAPQSIAEGLRLVLKAAESGTVFEAVQDRNQRIIDRATDEICDPPTPAPTASPTTSPTDSPTKRPTEWPTSSPTKRPTEWPTSSPTASPSKKPTASPTSSPSKKPTASPTESPTTSPSKKPTASPTSSPTSSPSKKPTVSPTSSPSKKPTASPTSSPTKNPTKSPTDSPTSSPTKNPTKSPTSSPTVSPSKNPTKSPTSSPTVSPTKNPTASPTTSPTASPSKKPTVSPTSSPSKKPTSSPTTSPTDSPTDSPTSSPSKKPTASPTSSPTDSPTSSPSKKPTTSPTASPSSSPTASPSASPTANPTQDTCLDSGDLYDIVLAVDTSCLLTAFECRQQQKLIAETLTGLRSGETFTVGSDQCFEQRIAYVEFGPDDSVNPVVSLQSDFNCGSKTTRDYFRHILSRTDDLCSPAALAQRAANQGEPDLLGALGFALEQFGDAESTDNGFDKEILVFSNCAVTDETQDDICDSIEPALTNTADAPGVNIAMVNLPAVTDNSPFDLDEPDTYISCLVEDDLDRIINEPVDSVEVNVVVIVDQTPGVGKPVFEQTLDFAVDVVQQFYQPTTTAVITFGQTVETVIDFTTLTQQPQIDNWWNQLTSTAVEGTATLEALEQAVELFDSSSDNYLVLLTDGVVAGEDPCDSSVLNSLQEYGVKLMLLAFADADLSALSCLIDFGVVVSVPGDGDLDFSEAITAIQVTVQSGDAFEAVLERNQRIIDLVTDEICDAPTPAPTEWPTEWPTPQPTKKWPTPQPTQQWPTPKPTQKRCIKVECNQKGNKNCKPQWSLRRKRDKKTVKKGGYEGYDCVEVDPREEYTLNVKKGCGEVAWYVDGKEAGRQDYDSDKKMKDFEIDCNKY